MSNHIEQARHNENLHTSLCEKFAEDFFDWKITVLFYAAYHLIKALATHRSVDIGDRHTYIRQNINPKNHNRILQLPNDVFEAYDELFEYSWTARYEGFINIETFKKIKMIDHKFAFARFNYIKQYIKSAGIELS